MRYRTFSRIGIVTLIFFGLLSFSMMLTATPARAALTYSEKLRACRNGYEWTQSVTFIGTDFEEVKIISVNPAGSGGVVLDELATNVTITEVFIGRWEKDQGAGTPVSITAQYDQRGNVTLNATVGDCVVGAAEGDWFTPDDDRIDPRPGDRIAVYCQPKWKELEVWGTDEKGNGFFLVLFDLEELSLAGPQGLTEKINPNSIVTATVNEKSRFFVSWYGGAYGANGQGDFTKSFICEFTHPPTLTPTKKPVRLPVHTVTPVATNTPVPTAVIW